MRFDQAWETVDADGVRGTDENDRPLALNGRHTGTITVVKEQNKDWAIGTGNPGGTVLTVKIDLGPDVRPVWDSIRIHWRHKIVELCQSARVAPPVVGVDWKEKSLIKQKVVVETATETGRNGEYVTVRRYLAQTELPPPAPAAEPPKASQGKPRAQKAQEGDAPSGGEDDIPF